MVVQEVGGVKRTVVNLQTLSHTNTDAHVHTNTHSQRLYGQLWTLVHCIHFLTPDRNHEIEKQSKRDF